MSKIVDCLIVEENRKLDDHYFVLTLRSQTPLPEILPGQFVNVLIDTSKETFLRRPFSVHDINAENHTISLLIKIAGNGTASLSRIEIGKPLNVIFPLGNSFTIEKGKKCLLVGGGCGVAPLFFLAKKLLENDNNFYILTGGKSDCDLMLKDNYRCLGTTLYTTEDGSFGEKGLVTGHSFMKSGLATIERIYACGPEMMMKEVASIAERKNIPCEVSLENRMACGFGVCLCCVAETHKGRRCVCTEGPVFNSKELLWPD